MRAQLLDAPRPTDLLAVVQRLTLLQIDPTAAIAPSADLVAWSRLGSVVPAGAAQAGAGAGPHAVRARRHGAADERPRPVPRRRGRLARATSKQRAWLQRQRPLPPRHPRAARRAPGRSSSRDIPDTCVVPWASTGWTNNRNVTQMLEFLMMRGEVAIAGRVGRERLWDLAERVYPPDVDVPPVEEAERRRTSGASPRSASPGRRPGRCRWSPTHVGDAGEPAVVEGVKGEWRVDPAALGDDFEGRTALLSPFDRLVHDRVRAEELFDFEYTLEMYKPADAAPLGLLRPPDPPRRPAGREARRSRRPQGLGAAGERDPRGREVHPRDGQGGAGRAGGPRRRGSGWPRSRRPEAQLRPAG